MCLVRHFERAVCNAQVNKRIEALIYLSLGQEAVAAGLALSMQGSFVLAQHRGHSFYLAFGGSPIKLVDELLGLPSGCCRGVGGSPCAHDLTNKIIGHCGLIGDQVPVAVGVALGAPDEKVLCIFGDGAAEEDYVLSALGYAATRKLKCLFVCDDNDLSVLTPTKDRRSWLMEDVAKAFGMPSVDITDDPWLIHYHAKRLSLELPALINVRTCRKNWHVGTGRDGEPEWDRFQLVEAELKRLGLWDGATKVNFETKQTVEKLWQERLQIQSENLPAST